MESRGDLKGAPEDGDGGGSGPDGDSREGEEKEWEASEGLGAAMLRTQPRAELLCTLGCLATVSPQPALPWGARGEHSGP